MIQIAVLGYGTVGSGVVEVIDTNHASINKKAGEDIEIKYVLDLREFPGDPVEKKLVHDFETIINDPDVRIIVETMGGVNPAYEFTKRALLAGKSVCTSNKELVAKHGPELLEIAKARDINYLFEASCGGGTTNYILSKMASDGSGFDEALKEAQEKGYAERNPEADVEGYDACRKIAILSSLAFGCHVDFEDIYTEGITRITATDIKYAQAIGTSIKLLATSRKIGDGFYAMVSPVMIDSNNPLFSVQGVFNAIFIHGNVLGDAMFYGSGAGKLPTASAVVADVVDCAKHLHRNIMMNWSSKKLELMDISQVTNRFFVRVAGSMAGELAGIEAVFGKVEPISIPSVTEEFAFITEEMTEAEYKEKAEMVTGIISMIRARF